MPTVFWNRTEQCVFRLCICRASNLCMISDKRKRGCFRPPPHIAPPPPEHRSVPGLCDQSPHLPLPGPRGCQDRASGGTDSGAQPAQRPALSALTRHANGLQHRPAEVAGGGLRGRGGREPGGPARTSETRSRGRLRSATWGRIGG